MGGMMRLKMTTTAYPYQRYFGHFLLLLYSRRKWRHNVHLLYSLGVWSLHEVGTSSLHIVLLQMPVYVDGLCGYTFFIHVTLASFFLSEHSCCLSWSLIGFLWIIEIESIQYVGKKGKVGVRGKNETGSKVVTSRREYIRSTGSLFTCIDSKYKYLRAPFTLSISCGLLSVWPTTHTSCLLHFWAQAPPFTAQPYIHHGKACSRLRPGWGWQW